MSGASDRSTLRLKRNGKTSQSAPAVASTSAAVTTDPGDASTSAAVTIDLGEASTSAAVTTDLGEASTSAAVTTDHGQAITSAAVTTDLGEASTSAAVTTDHGEAITSAAVTTDHGEASTSAAVAADLDFADFRRSSLDGEDPTVNNDPLNVEPRDQDGEINPTVIDWDYDLYNLAACDGRPTSEEEACRPASASMPQSFAWLNVNSNGQTSMTDTNSARETDMDTDGDLQQRQTGTDTDGALQQRQTDTTMEDVELSFPKGGMLLQMKLSAEEKQKLLENAKVQITSDQPKKRVRKATVKTADTQTETSPDLSFPSRSWTDVGDVNVNQYTMHSNTDSHRNIIHAPRAGFFVSNEPAEGSATFRTPAGLEDQRRQYGLDREDVMQSPLICDRQAAPQYTLRFDRDVLQPPCMTKGCTAGTVLYGQGKGTGAHPLLPGPSWRCDNEHIDVCNHDHFDTVSYRRQDADRRQQMCTNRSTGIDPLTQYLAGQPNDLLKRPGDQYSERDHQDKRARPNPQNCLNNSAGHGQMFYRRTSRDENEDMISEDETRTEITQPMNSRTVTTQVNHAVRDPPSSDKPVEDTNTADGRTTGHHHASHLTSSANEEPSVSTIATQCSSSSIDAARIAQIMQSARNMRKNMQQDYKNFSDLVKSYKADLPERNNDQSTECESDVTQPKKDKERCLIM